MVNNDRGVDLTEAGVFRSRHEYVVSPKPVEEPSHGSRRREVEISTA